MRWERERFRLRALRKSRELSPVVDRSASIRPADILVFSTLRNEKTRLPYFLKYYRDFGVNHFLFVDNGSTDGTSEYLAAQPDVSVWRTDAGYRAARFGADWMNGLLARHGHGHWCLTLDPDEFLVYPFCDTRPLRALTDWLDASGTRAYPAMLVDMYPRGPVHAQLYREGENPFESAAWFDGGNYSYKKNPISGELWIQGGPRARAFFADAPEKAPALNKIPLVRWRRGYAYVSSTHMLLPRGLNRVYDVDGGEKASGCLMHAKLLGTLQDKAEEELARGQHYAGGREYRAYAGAAGAGGDLWSKWSERYASWRQLESLGLMSKGNWA